MSHLTPMLVGVRKISPLGFIYQDRDRIEALAKAILQAGGLIKPLIVRRTSLESFQLLDNPLGYFAAVRARELDPLAAETVLAFVVESDEQERALLDMSRIIEEEQVYATARD